MTTDPDTVGIDDTSPLIGDPPQHSHLKDVVQYATETAAARTSFGGRILKLVYEKANLGRLATGQEFINYPVGTKPWGCEIVGNLLIVTLIGPRLVNAYDKTTGVLVWSVSAPGNFSPYGIRVYNGVGYVGLFQNNPPSAPLAGAVWKLDLTTRIWTKFFDCLVNGNSLFVNVGVGKLAGQIVVAYVTWSNNNFGWPAVHGEDGKRLPIGANNNSWGVPKGMMVPPGLSYAGACAVGQEQLIFSTVQDGLHRLSGPMPTDQIVPNDCFLGYQEFWNQDLQLKYGDYGFNDRGEKALGKYGPKIDALLKNVGHT
jgi:hypothetical protein